MCAITDGGRLLLRGKDRAARLVARPPSFDSVPLPVSIPCCLPVPAAPQVAAYCAVLDKDLRDRKKTSEVDVGETLGAGYASMFGGEVGRRLKQVPTAFYRSPPEALFADGACTADWAGWAF